MTIISPYQMQMAAIAYLKSNVAITSLLLDPNEIREDSWKGTDFSYPNIRVKILRTSPYTREANCSQTSGEWILLIFSEQKSSKEADSIAGTIANILHGKKFTNSGVNFYSTLVEFVTGAEAIGDTVWISEIHLRSLMS